MAYITPRFFCASASPASARARMSTRERAGVWSSCAWTGGLSTARPPRSFGSSHQPADTSSPPAAAPQDARSRLLNVEGPASAHCFRLRAGALGSGVRLPFMALSTVVPSGP